MGVDLGNPQVRAGKGYSGMLVDIKSSDGVINKINLTDDPIDFGVAVVSVPANGGCALLTADTQRIIGVSVRHVNFIGNTPGVMAYAKHASVPILEDGRMWVTPYEDVTKDAPVFARLSDGRLGATDTVGVTVAVPGARWEEAGVSTDVAPLVVSIPQGQGVS